MRKVRGIWRCERCVVTSQGTSKHTYHGTFVHQISFTHPQEGDFLVANADRLAFRHFESIFEKNLIEYCSEFEIVFSLSFASKSEPGKQTPTNM